VLGVVCIFPIVSPVTLYFLANSLWELKKGSSKRNLLISSISSFDNSSNVLNFFGIITDSLLGTGCL